MGGAKGKGWEWEEGRLVPDWRKDRRRDDRRPTPESRTDLDRKQFEEVR